jgi:hypothetical protein
MEARRKLENNLKRGEGANGKRIEKHEQLNKQHEMREEKQEARGEATGKLQRDGRQRWQRTQVRKARGLINCCVSTLECDL